MPDAADQSKTVFALHTSFALVQPLRPLFAELVSTVNIVNVVDDSLLSDVRVAGGLTPSVTRRILGYGLLAEASGANAIFNCCSSVGEAADLLARAVDIPVVKIDDRMTTEAVLQGSRIAVIATVATTLDPTSLLIETKASQQHKTVEVRRCLVQGAFDALMCGDASGHDRLVLSAIGRAASDCDVVVLAQASMARLMPQIGNLPALVLSSPRSGIQALRDALGLRANSAGAES